MKQLNEKAIYFNKIYVIQSLPDFEIQTGSELFDDIINRRTYEDSSLTAVKIDVTNRDELLDLLNQILIETKQKSIIPYLHIETHGYQKGVELKSGDKIEYKDLVEVLRKINIASQNNLFISVGACWGGHIQDVTDIFEPCVFRGFIGPMDKIQTGNLQLLFTEYFSELLLSQDFDKALQVLYAQNKSEVEFHCYRAESFFDKVANAKRKNHYRWERAIINKLWEQHSHKRNLFKSKNKFIEFIKPKLKIEEPLLMKEMRNLYLHIDNF